MEEKKIKKKKLTISTTSKKRTEPIHYTRGKRSSVVVEQKISRKKREIKIHGHQVKPNLNETSYTKKTEKGS